MELYKPLVENIYKHCKSRSGKNKIRLRKIGVMVAGGLPNSDTFVAGISLCHRLDSFDRVHVTDGFDVKDKGLGKRLAIRAALHSVGTGSIDIPESVEDEFSNFVARCSRYYKDRTPAKAIAGLVNKPNNQQDGK